MGSTYGAHGSAASAGRKRGGDVPRRRFGDVVVLLPGLTGSVLRRGGKDLWGPSVGTLLGAAKVQWEPIVPQE